MNEANIRVFVDAVSLYFEKLGDRPVVVGAPFLIQNINDYLLDFTGIIGISGNHKGSVFFTAPETMLNRVLQRLGVLGNDDAKLMDLAGEISNTISGNARREFGSEFMLSVPIVLKGKSEETRVSRVAEIIVIPINWQNMKGNIIVNLTEQGA